MRSLFKAAVYFFCHPVSSYVIPNPAALEAPKPADAIAEYAVLPKQAQLKFQLDVVKALGWIDPVFELEIGPTEKLCGETNVTLNGQPLTTEWLGIQGKGAGTIRAYGENLASWNIGCLWDSQDPNQGHFPDLGGITHILVFKFDNVKGPRDPTGFTISYKQFGQPSILRFEPVYHQPPASNSDFPEWRTAQFPFVVESPPPHRLEPTPQPSEPETFSQHPNDTANQKTLGMRIKESAKIAYERAKNFIQKFCPQHAQKVDNAQKLSSEGFVAQHQNETRAEDVDHDELDLQEGWVKIDKPTSVQQHAAAQTRALHNIPTSNDGLESSDIPHTLILKLVFFLLLLLGSLTAWLIIRCRDPRRRAERAALREERRTRRLYKCAARRQKFKNMVRSLRNRWGFASAAAIHFDEKNRRVAEQEAVLDHVVKNDIQALRDAHRAVSSMTSTASVQAEEGRSGYVYEEDGFGHRRLRSTRSVATLPEYQRESSRPPSYRSRRGSGTDFTSDSSVVSTSPRISRDGTNSDMDEKIEELDLREARVYDFQARA